MELNWLKTESETLHHGDSLEVLKALPDCSVQCCVTSPPYWGLRDYGQEGQLGLEKTPEEFIERLVALFREVRRVLREDGTLWVNIGDSYATGTTTKRTCNSNCLSSKTQKAQNNIPRNGTPQGCKSKDLVGIPWMLAFALRADGWYLRSEVIWSKRSPMPESVRDRPTKSHEQIFLLAKSPQYFYDHIGSQEEGSTKPSGNTTPGKYSGLTINGNDFRLKANLHLHGPTEKRNMRSVWTLSTYPLKAAHFAAYPPELVRKCLSAGISERGCCPTCGTPWTRVTEKKRTPTRKGTKSKVNRAGQHEDSPYEQHSGMIVGNRDAKRHITEVVTTGWKQSCNCESSDPVPCVVLDPFHGAGTTWKVCQRLGARYIGIELNEEYLRLSVDRPAVHFPHEKKKAKKRITKSSSKQMELFQ